MRQCSITKNLNFVSFAKANKDNKSQTKKPRLFGAFFYFETKRHQLLTKISENATLTEHSKL